MPTYEYICRHCKLTVDANRPSEDRDTPFGCIGCGDFMMRAMTAPPVHFKGTGFYKTGG